MKRYSRHNENGQFCDEVFCGESAPKDRGLWVEGVYSITRHRLNLATNEVELYQPPAPEATEAFTWEWDAESWEWQKRLTAAGQWELARAERNRRIAATDWTQGRDIPEAVSQKWQSYRQALRDITEQPDPFNIAWPEPPNSKA